VLGLATKTVRSGSATRGFALSDEEGIDEIPLGGMGWTAMGLMVVLVLDFTAAAASMPGYFFGICNCGAPPWAIWWVTSVYALLAVILALLIGEYRRVRKVQYIREARRSRHPANQ